jgi:rhodanese-related sulfurtransferase
MSISQITPAQFSQLDANGSSENGQAHTLIDVRTPVEFREIHAAPARNIPLDQLDPEKLRIQLGDDDHTVFLICRSGARGAQAGQKLRQAGFQKVFNIEGGTLAWDAAGLPVQRGKAVLTLERQVRIAVGIMVAVGGGLAAFVSPLWGLVPLAAGLGLVFAGLTGSCAMGMMLAKMPWNQCAEASEGSCCAS